VAPKNSPKNGSVALVVGDTPPEVTALRLTRIISPANTQQKNEILQAPLVPGAGLDTLRVTLSNRNQTGVLTVTSGSHTTLLSLSHIGWAGVAEYGKAHGPVILTGADQSLCGTGGCAYTAYTYTNAAKALVPVPFAPWKHLAYRFNPKQHNWTATPSNGVTSSSILGYAALTPLGLSISFRTYGPLNGNAEQRFVYALDGTPSGEWLPAEVENLGPDNFNDSVPYPESSLQTAATLYLSEAMDNHPLAAAKLAVPGINAQSLWDAVKPLTHDGLVGNLNTNTYQALNTTQAAVSISSTQGAGPAETLSDIAVTVTGRQVGGHWYVAHVTLSSTSLKYDSSFANSGT
jgi:hypothetical protein